MRRTHLLAIAILALAGCGLIRHAASVPIEREYCYSWSDGQSQCTAEGYWNHPHFHVKRAYAVFHHAWLNELQANGTYIQYEMEPDAGYHSTPPPVEWCKKAFCTAPPWDVPAPNQAEIMAEARALPTPTPCPKGDDWSCIR